MNFRIFVANIVLSVMSNPLRPVFVRLTPEMSEFVEKMSRSKGVTRQVVMRAALLHFMEKIDGKQE